MNSRRIECRSTIYGNQGQIMEVAVRTIPMKMGNPFLFTLVSVNYRFRMQAFSGQKCGRPIETRAFLSQVVVLRKFKTIAKTIPKDPYMLPSSSQPSKEDQPRSLLDLRRRWTRAICIGSVFALSHLEPSEVLSQQPPRKQESNRKVDSKAANAPRKTSEIPKIHRKKPSTSIPMQPISKTTPLTMLPSKSGPS